MIKTWQILPEIGGDAGGESRAVHPLLRRILYNRGIAEIEDAEFFLSADFSSGLHDPFLFRDMGAACDLIVSHLKKGSRIFVYGDYDADGVSSSALLMDLLRLFGADAQVYIPHRVSEGYGVNRAAVDYIAGQGAKLMITVDNGIRSREEIAYARSRGVETIVTDHHTPPTEQDAYPDCLVINPASANETYPDRNLSGAGVAYKLACALIARSKLEENAKDALARRYTDLAAIGTVADCVKLTGENRLLVKQGLIEIARTPRPGLSALCRAARIDSGKGMDSWNIGFQIAPRLNAAGRLDHANSAFQLLYTRDAQEANVLAEGLNERNQERQKITDEIYTEVKKQVDGRSDAILIGVYDLEKKKQIEETVWNEGVIGLVSGRISGKYYRPSLVITKTESGYKGSGRSIPEFNLIAAIEQCAPLLERFGGHPQACGFSLSAQNLGPFCEKISQIASSELALEKLSPKIKIEAALDLSEADSSLLLEIARLEPYGQGNERPVFAAFGVHVLDRQTMGAEGQHVKFKVKSDRSSMFNAIAFGEALKWADIAVGDKIDLAYYLELNTFNGRTEIQLKVVDIKKH